jgi:ribosomal protein L37AE/L43A
MKKEKIREILCPICKNGRLRSSEYDLCYCDECGEEFALNSHRGLLWYKRKNKKSYEREYVVLKKYTEKEIIRFRHIIK